MSNLSTVAEFVRGAFGVVLDEVTFLYLSLQPASALAAENLFLRKQLGLYIERKPKPRRATRFGSFNPGPIGQVFRLAWRPDHRCPFGKRA
jgi:hypothetical protein